MKIGPVDVGQFLAGAVGVVLFVAAFGLLVVVAVKVTGWWMRRGE